MKRIIVALIVAGLLSGCHHQMAAGVLAGAIVGSALSRPVHVIEHREPVIYQYYEYRHYYHPRGCRPEPVFDRYGNPVGYREFCR